jgi:hypothetical protein
MFYLCERERERQFIFGNLKGLPVVERLLPQSSDVTLKSELFHRVSEKSDNSCTLSDAAIKNTGMSVLMG